MRRTTFTVLSSYLLLLTFTSQCYATSLGLESLTGLKRGQSEYFNTNLDQRLTIQVQVVGGVSAPGIYHIPDTANLLDALSLAGGTNPNSDLAKVHLRRNEGGQYKTVVYDLAQVLHDTSKPLPALANHDIIMIEPQSQAVSNNLALIATIVGIISSGLLAYVTIHNIQQGK
ncbi:MAG: SLBB domain-containing protein [Deltaproteobacteria bacterium]|nr:SLBB domain-containing protein [Deltaproteobacteria bacterium]